MTQDFRDLIVWKRAIELTVCTYELTRRFPIDELYGLSSQLRRASVSVASNIAEGRGRLSVMEFRHFLALAQGSIYELQTQLIVAKSLSLASKEDLERAEALSTEVSKMLTALIQKLSVGITKKKLAARS